MKNIFTPIVLCLALPTLCLAQAAAAPQALPDGLYAEITIESTPPEGGEKIPRTVICELFYKKAPMTVASFVGLAEGTLGPNKGKPYFDGLPFGRVEANFLIQGGQGGGNIGYRLPDEIVPGLRHDGPGTLQMANAGPDTNGGQYCIMVSDQTSLNYNHPVFGKVVRGIEDVSKTTVGATMKVKILRVGTDAQSYKVEQAPFDDMIAKAGRFGDRPRTAGPDSYIDDPDGIVGAGGRGSNFLTVKLANFERFTGERVIARVYARTPADAAGDKLEAFLSALSTRMKLTDNGALVVYFQDQDKWIIRVGKNSQKNFIAGPMKPDGTRDPATAKPTIDAALADFLTAFAPPAPPPTPAATTPPATTTAPGRRGRGAATSTFAPRLARVLDNLIFRLEPGNFPK